MRDDGAFGSIESVDAEARTLRFDSGVFLEGSRAHEVAAEDGVTVQDDVVVKIEEQYLPQDGAWRREHHGRAWERIAGPRDVPNGR